MCGQFAKGTAREEAGTLLMEKRAEVLQQEGYAPKGYNSRKIRIENKMEGSNICGVWGVQVQRHQNTREPGIGFCLWRTVKEYLVQPMSQSIEVKREFSKRKRSS